MMEYREPFSAELNHTAVCCADCSGGEIRLCFDEQTLTASRDDAIILHAAYVCQKAADGLYFVVAGDACALIDKPRNACVLLQARKDGGFDAVSTRGARMPDAYSRLSGHTLSFLYAPGARFRHTFSDKDALCMLVCDDFALVRFCEDHRTWTLALDLHLLRAVGAVQQDAACAPRPVSAYATYVGKDTDDRLDYRVHLLYRRLENPLCARPMCGGLRQYVSPVCTELCGRSFELQTEEHENMTVCLSDGDAAVCQSGGRDRVYAYACVKCDDASYLLLLRDARQTHEALTLFLDTSSGGALLIQAELDAAHPQNRLVRSRITRCTLAGGQLPQQTDALTGRRMVWTYNPNDEIMHIYPRGDLFRLGHWDGVASDTPDENEKRALAWQAQRAVSYPIYEEPAVYYRLRDGLYLYCITEQNVNARLPEQGGNLLIVALSETLCRYAGRCFGRGGQLQVEDMRIGAVGRFEDTPDVAENAPVPFYR